MQNILLQCMPVFEKYEGSFSGYIVKRPRFFQKKNFSLFLPRKVNNRETKKKSKKKQTNKNIRNCGGVRLDLWLGILFLG